MATSTIKVSWRSSAVPIKIYGRRRYTPDFADALAEWERLAKKAGIPFRVSQGGFNGTAVSASASTHAGDAVDISVKNLSKDQVAKLNEIGRMIGMASWFRTSSAKWGTRGQGFSSYHIHAVPNGWGIPHPSAARQANSYRSGRDGLASNQPDLGPGHVTQYRTRTWADYKKAASPGVPSTGGSGTKPAAPIKPAQPSTGGLTVSDINTILAQLEEIKKQNRAIHGDLAGREAVDARREADTLAVWRFPVHRGSGPVMAISELAGQTDMLKTLLAQVSGLAKNAGVDEKTIINGVVAGITPLLKQSIIKAQGDIDLEAAEEFADAVLAAFREQLNK